jgi:hypothetical protein
VVHARLGDDVGSRLSIYPAVVDLHDQ